MSLSLFSLFCLNVFVNSVLVFLTTALAIETLFFLLRVKNHRVRYLCRLVPLAKLPFDLFRYNFSNWALGQGIDPTLCPKGTRCLNLSFHCDNILWPIFSGDIGFNVDQRFGFSVADILGLSLGSKVILGFSVFFVAMTCAVFLRRVMSYRKERHLAKRLFAKTSPCLRKIENEELDRKVKSWGVSLFVSEDAENPVVWKRRVLFPTALVENLSQSEFEAVIAHELAHTRWFDSVLNQAIYFVSALFWWVPMQRWLKRVEEEQEFGCDQSIFHFKIKGIDLASAIHKSLKGFRNNLVCQHVITHPVVKRVERLTKKLPPKKGILLPVQGVLVYSITCALLFGRLWIF